MRKEKLVALAAVTLILFAILPGLSFARPQNDAGSGMDAGNTQLYRNGRRNIIAIMRRR